MQTKLCFYQVLQCKRRRNIYPEKKYLMFHLLPGVVLAVTGMVLFAFLETKENYKFTHSAWHVAMSLSIVFLLPLRRQKGINRSTSAPITVTNTDNATNSTNSRIVLRSYAEIPNGHVTNSNSVEIDMGDNPAYMPPD